MKARTALMISPVRIVGCLMIILSSVSSVFAGESVFYYHTDPEGTPLAMTDANGIVVWRADYKPFGEENSINLQTKENDMRFVGKEKDKETGLQYFGARYMKDEIGRFITTDPVGPVDPRTSKTNYGMLTNPQRLNRYAYSLNNPYKYLDPNGKWPTEIHNTIIRTAFSGSLSKDAIAALMRGSRAADAMQYQDQAHSYMHAMKAEGQSPQEAERLMNNYIKQKVSEYKTLMSQGKTDAAYEALGMAMHPVMDSTSPVHEGFQEWKGWKDPIDSGYHVARESEPFFTQKDLSRTVDQVRKFYDLNQ